MDLSSHYQWRHFLCVYSNLKILNDRTVIYLFYNIALLIAQKGKKVFDNTETMSLFCKTRHKSNELFISIFQVVIKIFDILQTQTIL